MAKKIDLKSKTNSELIEMVTTGRETVRVERFKDKYSRKASVIGGAKLEVARALTELNARQAATK